MLAATKEGYELSTLDHTEGTLRLDLKRGWDAIASSSGSDEVDGQVCSGIHQKRMCMYMLALKLVP